MITNATYQGDYRILVQFDDGVKRLADFLPFISSSKFAFVRKYLNKDLFRQFYVNNWGLCWGDNDFDINPQDIHDGKFDAHA